MKIVNRFRRHVAVIAVIGLLAACAQPQQRLSTEPFPTDMANQVFKFGFQKISDRYLEQVSIKDIATEGLNGLSAIEPNFKSIVRGNEVIVESKNFGPFNYPAPGAVDADGWAGLIVAILVEARAQSDAFRNADPEGLYEAVFDGSLSLLDNFSRYSNAVQAAENRAKRSGFGGIGIRFTKTGAGALVTSVFKGSPAAALGLVKDDIITHVNGRSIIDLDRTSLRDLMRGPIGSVADLAIVRNSAPAFNVSIKRDRIILPTVFSREENGVIYARIKGFNNRTTRQLAGYVSATRRRLKERALGLIIDLRGNPGGLLTQAVDMADLFLRRGRILSTRGRHPSSRKDYTAQTNDIAAGLPIVVLINGRSASASEIVAAALQDNERAVVIGTSSFGKGTIQNVIRLPNDGEITLTWSRFITPSGYVLHGLGVPPYICTAKKINGEIGADEILNKAISGSDKISETMEKWRFVSLNDIVGREQLRTECPTSNARPGIDLEIAKRLLNDQTLYRRIISLSSSTTAAGS